MSIITTGNSVSLTAAEHRNQTAALLPPGKTALSVRGGVHSGLNMSKTSGMTFRISAGRAVVPPASPSAGPYVVTLTSDETMAFEPGDTTRNRVDIVALKVDEAAGVEAPGELVILKGAYPASGNPVAPTVPPAHLALFTVPVNAGVSAGNGGYVPGKVVDNRRYLSAVGGQIPVHSKAERDALAVYEGLQVLRLDLGGSVDRYVDGKWRGNTDWINCTLMPGWRNVLDTVMRVRVIGDGTLCQIWGEVKYIGGAPKVDEGWTIGTIPIANGIGIPPENNVWVLGTDESYRGTVVIQILADGRVNVGPAPNGKVFMFQGTFPLNIAG